MPIKKKEKKKANNFEILKMFFLSSSCVEKICGKNKDKAKKRKMKKLKEKKKKHKIEEIEEALLK